MLFDELTRSTVETVRSTGLDYYLIDEELQQGRGFGERFYHAIQFVLAQGHDNIITVGNDTPHLKSENILHAAGNLEGDVATFGKSTDGGFYLMGLQGYAFAKAGKQTFTSLHWQTGTILQEMTSLLQDLCVCLVATTLDSLIDIDGAEDLQKVIDLAKPINETVLQLIMILLSIEEYQMDVYFDLLREPLTGTYYNKGSPHLA